jgi:hypothetical protein
MDYGNGEGSFCRFLYILHVGGGGGGAEEKLLIKQQSKVGIGDPLCDFIFFPFFIGQTQYQSSTMCSFLNESPNYQFYQSGLLSVYISSVEYLCENIIQG